MGYKIRILNDVVAKMTPGQLLLMCKIVGLLQVFDDSSSMTLLDALIRAVASSAASEEDENVRLYVTALSLIGLRDFREFLQQPFVKFFEQTFVQIEIKLVCEGSSRSQLVIRASGPMQASQNDHPVVYLDQICKPAIIDALIPADTRLKSGNYNTAPNLSSDGSFWADMCPMCGYFCGRFSDHMDKSCGQFPNLGRGMWESIITETAKEFFFMFCSEYAKFVCWVLENPFIFANRMIRRSNPFRTGCNFKMRMPFLPGIFIHRFFMKTLQPCFETLPTQDGGCILVPKPFMLMIHPNPTNMYQPIKDSEHKSFDEILASMCRQPKVKPKSKKTVQPTGMLTRVAQSLGCSDRFADSILRRVLHTLNEGIIRKFKDENLILTEKLLRILGHFKCIGLLPALEELAELLQLPA
jgi:hypothetical protein